MIDFITKGDLTRLLALIFLFLSGIGSGVVVSYQIILNQPPNSIAVGVLLSIIGTSANIIGVHMGVTSLISGMNIPIVANTDATQANTIALQQTRSTVPP